MSKNIRETVVFETWKRLLRSTTDTPNRRRIKHNKRCSNIVRTFDSLASLIQKVILKYHGLASQYNTVHLLDFPQNKLGHI